METGKEKISRPPKLKVTDERYTYSMEELDALTEKAIRESREGKCTPYDMPSEKSSDGHWTI